MGELLPDQADVVLVTLPFGPAESPSLALGLLQSRLASADIGTVTRHFTLDYAAMVGTEGYRRIVAGFPRTTDLLGEWIFSHAIHPRDPNPRDGYLDRTFGTLLADLPDGDLDDDYVDSVTRIRESVADLAEAAGEFTDFVARQILAHRPSVVGLTTVFQQNLATIAVASRLRALDPSIRIMVGGANCEGPMGRALAENYPFFDAVVSGEADLLVVPLVTSLLAKEKPHLSPGVLSFVESVSDAGVLLEAAPLPDLDDYVSPSFQDYFRQRASIASGLPLQIPLESSRGCWWGMKHHCTFCGLNGATMSFRSRSPDAVISEIVSVANGRPTAEVMFVDNIMDHRYYDTFLPRLAELNINVNLFYEIKSNVTRDRVRRLKAAGVAHIQPGIESLSDQVLALMRKGVSALQNIQLLKWCVEFDIDVDWNILCGFPGEHESEYEKMAQLIPLICHLQPPARCSEIRLDRFSPNFEQADEFGFTNVRPYDAYFDVHQGIAPDEVFHLAYFFEADSASTRRLRKYTRSLVAAVDEWRSTHESNRLVYVGAADKVMVFDSRSMRSGPPIQILEGLEATLLESCDSVQAIPSMRRSISGSTRDEVQAALSRLCARGLMVSRAGRYLSLPVALPGLLEAHAGSFGVKDFLHAEDILDVSVEVALPRPRSQQSVSDGSE